MTTPSRVALLGAHPVFRKALRAVLDRQADMSVVAEGDCADVDLARLSASQPQLIVAQFDANVPPLMRLMDIASSAPGARLMLIVPHAVPHVVGRLRDIGARAIVVASATPDELVLVCRSVLAGYSCLPPRRDDPVLSGLSNGEYAVFVGMAHECSIKEMARQFGLSVTTVASYKGRMMRKLHIASPLELIDLAVSLDIVNAGPAPRA